jgi:hypothetical protein
MALFIDDISGFAANVHAAVLFPCGNDITLHASICFQFKLTVTSPTAPWRGEVVRSMRHSLFTISTGNGDRCQAAP